jgi:DNA (cytosine-5)-methyltransferase 1
MPGSKKSRSLRVVGLFAGIGGIELGLGRAGHSAELLCEIDDGAVEVLRAQLSEVETHLDVTTLASLPECDLLAAGFPCQDLSQAGRTAGIGGTQSGLVEHVFRLLDGAHPGPTWLMLENVPFMLSLERGEAMRSLVDRLEDRGWTWAYRVVDTMAFGLPQRRRRVLLLASRTEDPRAPLLNQSVDAALPELHDGAQACGFYWTEGLRGLGWAIDAIPTLKGGSTIGIPSPPAIWDPNSAELFTPHLSDAERLQGFPAGWTAIAGASGSRNLGRRWKLIGNAVSVPVAEWLGDRIGSSDPYAPESERRLKGDKWPHAAWGKAGERHEVDATMWPVARKRPHLLDFLEHEGKPLSVRATAGFLERTERSNLRISEDFLLDAKAHLVSMDESAELALA